MAEAIFRSLLAGRENEGEWRVASAGVWGMDGSLAASGTRAALQKLGIDVSGHRAQSVSGELIWQYNLVLVMERGHLEGLREEFPEMRGRIYLVTEMAGMRHNIYDPMGGSAEDYEDTARELKQILSKGLDEIERLASG
jgi:protein-tyrosine phosphatase